MYISTGKARDYMEGLIYEKRLFGQSYMNNLIFD